MQNKAIKLTTKCLQTAILSTETPQKSMAKNKDFFHNFSLQLTFMATTQHFIVDLSCLLAKKINKVKQASRVSRLYQAELCDMNNISGKIQTSRNPIGLYKIDLKKLNITRQVTYPCHPNSNIFYDIFIYLSFIIMNRIKGN